MSERDGGKCKVITLKGDAGVFTSLELFQVPLQDVNLLQGVVV